MEILNSFFALFKILINNEKIKKYIILYSTFLFTQHLNAQSNTFLWAKQMGGISGDYGQSISVDATGNIYTTGTFDGTADFDPGPGIYNLTSATGTYDFFISKVDASGNFLWAKQISGPNGGINSISVDATGNVYTTGFFGGFGGTVDFDPGTGAYNLTSMGGHEIFILKIDASGNFIWARQMGGASDDKANSIAVDANGNVYTTGYFWFTADFDPGPGNYNLTSVFFQDIFIPKLDASGNFVWAKQFAGTNSEEGFSIAIDGTGNVYATGVFDGTVDFDPGTGAYNLTSLGGWDIFVTKLDDSGNFLWAKQKGGTNDDRGKSVAVDAAGNVYTTGYFQGTSDFDPGIGNYNLTSAGGSDIFVSKLNASGNFLWAKRIGGGNGEASNSITVDSNECIYITGNFSGTADFDPGSGIYNLISAGGSDIFTSKLDALGNLLWAKQFGGTSDEAGNSVTIDPNGNIYTTGYFSGTTDFDPENGTYNLTAFGIYDVFLAKLSVAQSTIVYTPNFLWAKDMGSGALQNEGKSTAVDAYGNVYTTGYFQGTSDFDPGSGTYNLISTGVSDIFISKLDASGNFLWAKQIGGPVTDEGRSIAIDANGNICVTGIFFGNVDFDPGTGVNNLDYANGNIFILKLDALGNLLWVKQFGNSITNVYSMKLDANGNIYTSGHFQLTADFDPGAGINNLTTAGNNAEIFISKLNVSGDFIWAKQIGNMPGGGGGATAYSITVDASGNVYTTGSFVPPVDFDPGPGVYNMGSNGSSDAFVSKLDPSGNFLWAKGWGGADADIAYSIAVDVNGNVYTTGRFSNTVDFDPGAGVYNLNSFGNTDVFVSKLDGSGNFIWAKKMGGAINDIGRSITVDPNSNVYITGNFETIADFDPGPGTYNLNSFGNHDIFVSKLDVSGNFIWAINMGGITQDEGNSITTDVTGNIYLTGFFGETADFDPGPGTYNLIAGGYDVFATKLGDPLTIITPQIFLDKALIQYGQTDIIWGKYFTPNGQIKLTISNETQQTNIADTIINANSQGYFNFTYNFISSLPPGVYNILATDQITLRSSYLVRLVVVSTAPVITRDLKVTSPVSNSTVGAPIKIEWSDRPSHIITLISNTGSVNASYVIEYNKDNTGWQVITTKSYKANYRQQSAFQYNYVPLEIGSYQFRVTDNLDPLNTDVSSNIDIADPTTGVRIAYEWDSSGNRPNNKPIGLAADGTARIYVKISKKAGNNKTISNVTITVSDPIYPSITETRLLGKLKKATDTSGYSLEANDANLTTEISSTSGSGNTFWFWYVAPDDFVRNDDDTLLSYRRLTFNALINYSDNSTDNVTKVVEIVRPPLMFVHGIGGNEKTWDEFCYSMNGTQRHFTRESDSRWKFRRALNMYAGGSYIQNAQLLLTLSNSGFKLNADISESYNSNSFQYFLQQMRIKGYSCNRVDYVAHSMGGDIARTAINLYSTETPFNFNAAEYKPSPSLLRKFKNYNSGFINKLITLNTPHNGSPIPDLIIEKLSQNWIVKNLLQASYNSGYGLDGYLIRAAFNIVGSTNKLDFNNPTEAFKNLRYGINGVKFQQSTIKNHLISGDLLIGGEDCLDAYNIIRKDKDLGLIVKIFAAIGGTTCIAIDEIFVPYGVTDFIENSDFVVPLSSQLPGKNITGSGNDYSIYYGKNPNHLSIHNSNKNPSVGQKVFSLLNAPINSTNFANTIAANTSPGSIIYRPSTVNNFSEWVDTSKIIITSPTRGTSYSVDSTVTITVRLKDTLNFKYLNVLFQSEIYKSSSKATSQNFSVQINPVFIDSQLIVATAVYDSLGYDVEWTDTLSVNILKDSVINGFYITPKTKYLNSGETYIPIYNLIHNSYITNVSILDTALHIVVANTNVATYSNTQKNFIAKDTGTTYAIISYKQFKDTLFIIIDTTNFTPGTPLPVTLISFTGFAKPVYNLLEWRTTSEINFSHFILQRSTDAFSWSNIIRLDARSNSTSSITDYNYLDSVISNKNTFYRLLLVDIDGTSKVSNVVLIRRNNSNSPIRVFPNPVTKGEVFVDLGGYTVSSKVTITIVDLTGKTIKIINQIVQNNNLIRLDLYGLKPSIYLLKIQRGDNMQTIKLVLIE